MKAKLYEIPKKMIWSAYLDVKRSGGGAGIDGQKMEDFEQNLKNNLYKIWNRMTSGTYFPPPVLRVEIPKADGGIRELGVPTIEDRIAQAVVKRFLEPKAESRFHSDSYGYRPKRSAIDAVAQARRRCWRYNWVLDLDIKSFFDTLDHELVLRAVRRFTDCRWALLYIERWLKAEVKLTNGVKVRREKGTPQGGVMSPLLANIFMHLAFDQWMQENHPQVLFERYADDIVVHCRSLQEAEKLKELIGQRLLKCKLQLHPGKTKIVYCKDSNRKMEVASKKFDFLGFTFRPRSARNKEGKFFVSYSPAISGKAATRLRQIIRREWTLTKKTFLSLNEIAAWLNPKINGWITYYGNFCKSALSTIFSSINWALVQWVQRKFKPYRGHATKASKWLKSVAKRDINLFVHWRFGFVKVE